MEYGQMATLIFFNKKKYYCTNFGKFFNKITFFPVNANESGFLQTIVNSY